MKFVCNELVTLAIFIIIIFFFLNRKSWHTCACPLCYYEVELKSNDLWNTNLELNAFAEINCLLLSFDTLKRGKKIKCQGIRER